VTDFVASRPPIAKAVLKNALKIRVSKIYNGK